MTGSDQVRVIEKAIVILDVLRRHGGSVGISTISKETGLAKSTVFRLLTTLTSRGHTRREQTTEKYSWE